MSIQQPNIMLLPGPGDGNGNGDGNPLHCRPGSALESISLVVTPAGDDTGRTFVPAGTQVALFGSAQIRRWFPDCTSIVSDGPIQWELFYQAVGSGQSTDITSVLQGGQTAKMTSFNACFPGIYNATLLCPVVSAAKGYTIYAGAAFNLSGTAELWVHNDFVGDTTFNNIAVHVVMIAMPDSGQVLARLDPIKVSQFVITQMSGGDGFLDSETGRLDLHLVLNISGPANGTCDVVISTEKTITPQQDPSMMTSGQRRDANGMLTLVGDAPVVGPTGTTHAWLKVNGQLNP